MGHPNKVYLGIEIYLVTSGIDLELWLCTRLIVYIFLGGGYDYKPRISSNLASLLGLYHEGRPSYGGNPLVTISYLQCECV